MLLTSNVIFKMGLTKEKIISDYNYFKSKAISYCHQGDIEKSVKFTELAARIGYKFNFRYTDDELEDTIHNLGFQILPQGVSYTGRENKFVFFDSFAIDNRNLTIQYLKAIFSWGGEILFITSKTNIGKNILLELNKYSKSAIYVVEGSSFSEKVSNTANAIESFKPGKVFLQYSPWDILGFVIWSQIKSPERFLINLTDHAFWLGKSTADYFLEFRNYGCNISVKFRNIPIEKLILQPYYPLKTTNLFSGFPINKGKKILAFAGSGYYKIYGHNFLFLKLMQEVLKQNRNLVFLFAGTGNPKPLLEFIEKNNLKDRFILIGNRNDLSEVFKQIDIYVNTFPLFGALMSQYAAINGIPIIGYSDSNNYSFNDSEDFLGIERSGIIVRSTIPDFIEYFNLLVSDKAERERNINYTKDSVITEKEFNEVLLKNVTNKKRNINTNSINTSINTEGIFDTYFDIQTNFLNEYYLIIFTTLKISLFKCKIGLILRTLFGSHGKILPFLKIVYKIIFHK